ncbi:protein-L-isoaspartate O-methyltransferase family protein [Methylophaga sulfidovorans]|uniref:Protein-L-isoaspartate O-methyltransferase n=1 Tax=Methylophaga sulfidovorans TaxID=45496 RepID=A0A1I3U0B1_9GAMM|nr:protein-L-isoaspartate O-methyltransferase [Methylophaga sulfidovorans]SFJ76400.1 protein-L-isoaspartate(D-aspartate) O-methyltransferase [Methylophaga sulfidovorans]
MSSLNHAHTNMVIQQVRPSEVLNDTVLAVMSDVVRADFVDEDSVGMAYADTMLTIAHEQCMLTPILEGRFLQALDLAPETNVLEIGTGSGYFTALLAKLSKHVISVEYYADLSELAAERLAKADIRNVTLTVGDASQGWPLVERVDTIVITAACAQIPDDYLQSLKVGGKLLIVTGTAPAMSVQLITRMNEREWQPKFLFETVIPYMINGEPIQQFEF